MLQTENEKVYIEHCQGCSSHSWCTKHDETKYSSYYENCKGKIVAICPEVQIVANQIPLAFKKKFSDDENSKPWEGKFCFPRIGAFEIYFQDKIIFSKLETGLWPQSAVVANKIREILNSSKIPQKNSQFVKSNILKKRKKKSWKPRDIKSIEPNSSRKYSFRGKSSTPHRKFIEEDSRLTDEFMNVKKHKDASVRNKKNSGEYSDDFDEGKTKYFKKNRQVSKVYELVLPASSLSNKVTAI